MVIPPFIVQPLSIQYLADLIWQVARNHFPPIEREYRELHYTENELQEHLTRTFF